MAESAYTTQDEALQAVRPGWHIVGSRDDYEDAPFTTPDGKPPLPSDPKTVKKLIGRVLVIQGPNGEPDEMTVGPSDKSVTWDTSIDPATNQPKPLQPGLVIIKGPSKGPAAAGAKPATPAAGLERLDANLNVITDPSKPAVYVRDPNAPAGTQPFKLDDSQTLSDPSTWTPITNPNNPKQVIGLFDSKAGKVAAVVPAATGSKDTDPSKWTPVYRTPGDPKSGIVGQFDPTNNELHAVSAAPDGKQVVITDTGIYVVDKDTGVATLSTTIDKTSPVQVVTYPDGSIYTFDPNEKDKSKSLTRLQGTQPPPTIKQQTPGGEVTLVYDDATKSYKLPPGTTLPATVDAPGSAALEYIIYRDDKGNEITRQKNPNYRPVQTTQGAQSLTAKQIQQWNQKTGQWEWVENKGRVTASDALRNMAQTLSKQIIDKDISEDEATKIITAANTAMTNDVAQQTAAANAAQSVLTSTAQGATTGAGMLNQRVSSATGALNSMMSSMAGSNMQNLPAGTGAQLVRGLGSWVTGLGGGDATYDAAARMVQAADPKVSGDPTVAQQATQALQQMFQEYQRQNGKPAPQVAATVAAQQSQQNGGMAAPVTRAPAQPPTPVVQPAAVASGVQAPPNPVPGQNYGNTLAYTGGVAPSQYGYTPPGGSSYSYGGPVPWAGATPQRLPFIAPVTV